MIETMDTHKIKRPNEANDEMIKGPVHSLSDAKIKRKDLCLKCNENETNPKRKGNLQRVERTYLNVCYTKFERHGEMIERGYRRIQLVTDPGP